MIRILLPLLFLFVTQAGADNPLSRDEKRLLHSWGLYLAVGGRLEMLDESAAESDYQRWIPEIPPEHEVGAKESFMLNLEPVVVPSAGLAASASSN